MLTVIEFSESCHDPGRCQQYSKVEICDVTGPAGWLMLTDTGNDGHKAGGVGGIQQGQTAACRQHSNSKNMLSQDHHQHWRLMLTDTGNEGHKARAVGGIQKHQTAARSQNTVAQRMLVLVVIEL